jgi:hypothetical protein
MKYTLETFELKTLLIQAAELGAKRALIAVGNIKPILTKQEAYKLASRKTVERAIKEGTLKTTKKGGVTSKVWIDRRSFEEWILKNELNGSF